MTKMRVPLAVPSDGAHRLAWWIAAGADPEERIEDLAGGIMTALGMIDRLLSGDVVPEGVFAAAIARETEGAALPADWKRPASGPWGDRPLPRPFEFARPPSGQQKMMDRARTAGGTAGRATVLPAPGAAATA
jgi:hypothetical protein